MGIERTKILKSDDYIMSSIFDELTQISPDEEDNDPFTTVSDRDNLYIIHRGRPPKEHTPVAPLLLNVVWPDNIWGKGLQIYSIKHRDKNLPPPVSPDDDILRFDSKFESGNLSRAYRITGNSYHLILEYDHNSSGSCQWFYFQITNIRKDVEYQFYISGFHKETSLFTSGSKVFYYSNKRAWDEDISWTRGGTDYAYSVTNRTKNKLKRATLQFKIKFPHDNDECYICYALPYTYSDLLRSIKNWEEKSRPGIIKSEILCQTLCGRDVPVLTITHPNSPIPLVGKSCVFLTGRIHPGESNGSYVLHGLIDYLLSENPDAKYILDNTIVRVVPMISIDGVTEGSYRNSLMGQDLNRLWTKPNEVLQPVIYKTKKLIAQTAMERPLIVYIDFHGHSTLHGTFIFGCPNSTDLGLKDSEKTFPRILSFINDEFSWEHCEFSFPKERKDAGRIVVRREMGVVQSFTIETSFGCVKAGKNAGMLYDELLWKNIGHGMGEAIYHLMIPTASPIVSYVNKELAFFAPRLSSQDSDNSQSTQIEETVKVNVSYEKFKDNNPLAGFNAEPVTKSDGSRLLYRVKAPEVLLEVDPDMISNSPPPLILPKWDQLKFNVK